MIKIKGIYLEGIIYTSICNNNVVVIIINVIITITSSSIYHFF